MDSNDLGYDRGRICKDGTEGSHALQKAKLGSQSSATWDLGVEANSVKPGHVKDNGLVQINENTASQLWVVATNSCGIWVQFNL